MCEVIMRKFLFGVLIIGFMGVLAGCSKSEDKVEALLPEQIMYGDTVFTYGEEYVETEGFTISENLVKLTMLADSNSVVLNDDGDIRVFYIQNDSATTYKGIKVGDDIQKVEKEFDHEYKDGEQYWVMFDGENEVEQNSSDMEDDWIWIIYTCEDEKIQSIMIYDSEFARTMK